MKRLGLLALLLMAMPLTAADKDTMLYEMRTYWAADGKLDDLHARFKNHSMKLLAKHGMMDICYWVPVDNKDNRLIHVVAHKNKEAAEASWKGFAADEDWKKAQADSTKNGGLVTKLTHVYLNKTDFSPNKHGNPGEEHVFELRTYIATPNNLANLKSRFRDHTVKLFEKHGMTNVAYTTIDDGETTTNGEMLKAFAKAGDDKADAKMDAEAKATALIYVLAHKTPAAAKKSFDAFRMDPAWTAAKAESEAKGGGSLTVKDGVKSLFLKTTDYSPNK